MCPEWHRSGVLLASIWSLVLTGCGLFEPRDPRPGGGVGVSCLVPNTPENVIANLLDHYASGPGLTCYVSMLDSAFLFHPDGQDSIEALPDTVYASWNRDVEARVTSDLAANTTFRVAVIDTEYAPRVISVDHQIRFYKYHLIIHASRAAPDTLFSGLADITFFQGTDAQWHITNWVDKRDGSGARTWGYLRRLYRVGF